MKALSRTLISVLVDHPKPILLAFAACIAALAWQSTRFEIDASAETLLTKNNRLYIQTQVANRRFSPQEFLLLAYRPLERPALSQESFDDIQEITERINRLERVDTTRSILNAPFPTLYKGELTGDIDLASITLENIDYSFSELEELLRGHPLYENLLINESQTALALQVTFKSDPEVERIENRITELQSERLGRDLKPTEKDELKSLKKQAEPLRAQLDSQRNQEIEAIREIMADYEQENDLYLGGAYVLAYQLIEIIKNDLIVFGFAIAIVISLLLLLLFRELRWVLVPIVCCCISVVMTMGLFGFFGLKATVISANFVALQLILTLAIVIHLIVQYREFEREDSGASHPALVRKTLNHKVAPCFYAGITTSIGFATLLFSGLQPVISFGLMMIIAVFVSIVTSLILFPCLLSFFNRDGKKGDGPFTGSVLSVFQNLALQHRIMVVVTAFLILIASVVGSLKLEVENSFIDYFRDSTQISRELTFIDKQFGGTTPLDLIYTVPQELKKPELIISADTISELQRIQNQLQSFPAVGKILSVINLAQVAKRVNEDRPLTEYELTAAYHTIDENLRSSLLGSFFSPDTDQARFSIRIQDTTEGLNRAELLGSIRSSLQDNLGLSENQFQLTGLFVLYQDILQRLFESQILTLGIVFIALSLTFFAIFRSLRIALVAIVPNILSTALVLGTMGWLGIPLDLMTITIAAIAMGIAVDDTIHYIHRYREEVASGTEVEAVRRTHRSVGYALLYTTTVIVIGFAMLGFSDFVPSILFGLLTGLSMLAALALDLTLLPALLRAFVHGDRRPEPSSG